MPNIKGAHLTVTGGIWDGTRIPLTGRLIVLGRHWQNDIVIRGPTVSRRHAYIVETPRGVVLRDLSSANGTYVNRGKIGATEHLLRNGVQIRLGVSEVTLVFTPEVVGYPVLWSAARAIRPAV